MTVQSLLSGSPLLMGDNTTPGVRIPENILKRIPEIDRVCKEFGLVYNPFVVEFLTYDEISEVAAYGGFPVRYPHWQWGMEFEELARGYQFGRRKIYEMVVNCLHGNTKVPTSRGTIPASEVQAGDTVFSANGSRTVAKVEKQKKSKTLVVKMKGQVRNLTCTPNHKWLTMRDDGPVWVEAKDIKAGDLLMGGDIYGHYQNCPAKTKWGEMTLELAEWLGTVMSAGMKCFTNKQQNGDYIENVSSLFECVLSEHGFPDFTTETKTIPDFIWASSNEYRAAFLRGLFDGSGEIDTEISFSCSDVAVVSDVQLLLAEMGIYSEVSKSNDVWVLTISWCETIGKFCKRIGSSVNDNNNKLNALTNYVVWEDAYVFSRGVDGIHVPYVQKKIMEIAKQHYGYGTNGNTLLSNAWDAIKDTKAGQDTLSNFIMTVFEAGYSKFAELYDLVRNPLYVVEEVSEGEEAETVDIALFNDSHDFMANGVISHNTNPLYIYCLDSNPEVDHVTVIAHALGHGHFFKNNIFFGHTSGNMMNDLASHGTRIERYMRRWGRETVSEFIDKVLSIDDLIDPAAVWQKRKYKEPVVTDSRTYKFPHRFKTDEGHDYMNPWLNNKEWLAKQHTKIKEDEVKTALGISTKNGKIRDVMGYLKEHAPLTIWQRDIMAMLHDEAKYFMPQRYTKTINEGAASYVDYNVMAKLGLAGDDGIVDYAIHKAGVLGGKYSVNPYALGFKLLMEIEDRWNKGKFGSDWDNCKNMREREEWDKKLGMGKQKVFEVIKYYNDYLLIAEFFDKEFCDKYEFYEWRLFPNGEYKIVSRDFKKIKASLLARYRNGGQPDIRLVEPNYRGKGVFLLEHQWDGRGLHPLETSDTLRAIFHLWKRPCAVSTRDEDNPDDEIVCCCTGPSKDSVEWMKRDAFESKAF